MEMVVARGAVLVGVMCLNLIQYVWARGKERRMSDVWVSCGV